MSIEWKYVKELKDPICVKEFLRKYHIRLPQNITDCILKYNGGRPHDKDITTRNGEGYVFKNLLSYNKDDKENIYSIYPDLFRGTDLFPIGLESSGDMVCFNNKTRRIVLWKHETDKTEVITKMKCLDIG